MCEAAHAFFFVRPFSSALASARRSMTHTDEYGRKKSRHLS
ncbi:hypothetical protein OH687_09445 [Burkholderia anthina]|nr:hypothetical protein OH687_09445 [Burkholderia anthina]